MAVFDATILLPMLWPGVPPPRDEFTQQPVGGYRERIDYLIERLEKDRIKIIIPTPALSEILVRAGSAGAEYLDRINASSAFKIVPFDQRAAVEVAAMTREAIDAGNKLGGLEGTWAKIKYDRQIFAVSKVENANVVYSDDRNMRTLCNRHGMTIVRTAELPLPPEKPEDKQQSLFARMESDEAEEPPPDEG